MDSDLKAFLLNCFIGGETGEIQPDGRWTRNKIELLFGGYNLTIVQNPEVITAKNLSRYRGQAIDTTTVVVHDVKVEQQKKF